jgi:DNA modification methylase
VSCVRLIQGDTRTVMTSLSAGSVQCCVTSPPYYGLRNYGVAGQIGLEQTPDEYVAVLVSVFREVWRVLADDGTLWLNLGDSYAGGGGYSPGSPSNVAGSKSARHGGEQGGRPPGIKIGNGMKPKDLMGIPWRVAFALQSDGWYLRSEIIWHKPNPMPESVTDRPTNAHEKVFLLTKRERYFYDADAVRESSVSPKQEAHNQRYARSYAAFDDRASESGQPGNVNNVGIHSRPGPGGRNARNVWTIGTKPFVGAHFATMPIALAERCIRAGSKMGDTVLDPFGGAATTGVAAVTLGRRAVLAELNPDYIILARARVDQAEDRLIGLFSAARRNAKARVELAAALWSVNKLQYAR